MATIFNKKLEELQTVISKMSLEVCASEVLPELGLQWHDLKQEVRRARLTMTRRNAARILRRLAAQTLTVEEVDAIVGKLRIKSVAFSKTLVWRAVRLEELLREPVPVRVWAEEVTCRVKTAVWRDVNARAEVHSCKLGDYVFLSVYHARVAAPPLYVCVVPPKPVCGVTSLRPQLLRPVVEGIGFRRYVDAEVSGRDIVSLLRIPYRRYCMADEDSSDSEMSHG